jgi:hypothetical protein
MTCAGSAATTVGLLGADQGGDVAAQEVDYRRGFRGDEEGGGQRAHGVLPRSTVVRSALR